MSSTWDEIEAQDQRRLAQRDAENEQEDRKSAAVKMIDCPFCGEGDFDKEGLKYHFEQGYCEDYNSVKTDPPKPWFGDEVLDD